MGVSASLLNKIGSGSLGLAGGDSQLWVHIKVIQAVLDHVTSKFLGVGPRLGISQVPG